MKIKFSRFAFLAVMVIVGLAFFASNSWAPTLNVVVTKTATPSFTRTYHWDIEKSADKTSVTLALGQQVQANYSVVMDLTGYSDTDFRVIGNIAINNSSAVSVAINGVSDGISGAGAAAVSCGVVFPYTLAAGATLNCTYSAVLPDGASRINTATVSFQYGETSTSSQGSTAIDFSGVEPTKIDECVSVNDTYAGALGAVCLSDTVFQYSRWIGPHERCGDYTVPNTASFVTNDSGSTGSADWSVAINVPCAEGCTLTPGYWKTHSKYGPAPYDDTWVMIGEDTTFFRSGQTYYQVLWTSPSGGNAYYILAHAYIAARLNILNGASIPGDIEDILDAAGGLFEGYTPTHVGLKGRNSTNLRATFIGYAAILDAYNNGDTGPGHCSE